MNVRRLEVGCLLGALAAGLVLRLVLIGQTWAADELATRAIAVQPTPGQAYDQFLATENTPPLFYVIEWLLARISDSAVLLRMPSLIAGMATLVLVWLLGRRVFDWSAGLVAVAVMALSPYAAFYATEARAYALMMAFLVGSTLVLLEAVKRNGVRWWIGYGVLCTLALWSHYTAVFVIATQAFWGLWVYPRSRAGLIASQAIIAITFIPWASHIEGGRAEAAIASLVPLSLHNVAEQAAILIVGAGNVSLDVIPGTALGIVVGAVVVTAAAFDALRQLAPPRPSLRREVVLIIALALATPLGVLAYSVLFKDLFITRNLLASLPAACVAIGATLTRLPRWWAAAATAMVLGGFAIAAVHSATPSVQRPDYDGAASYLDANAGPNEPILDVTVIGYAGDQSPLQISLDRPHDLVGGGGGPAANQAWASRGPVFLAAPEAFLTVFTPPPGMHLVSERRFEGAIPIGVNTYTRR